MNIDLARSVQELMEQGFGNRTIAERLGISRSTAHSYQVYIRAGLFEETTRRPALVEMVDNGASQIEVGRANGMGATAAKTLVQKVTGNYEPLDNELRLEFARGTTLHKLKNRFGSHINLDNLVEIANDAFPKKMIVSTFAMPDGDTKVIVIPDHTDQYDWTLDNKESPFRYRINAENNYMYVTLSDNLPDEIKIYNFTDTHIGAKACRTELLKRHIKMVEEDPSALAVLGGDIFEFMHKTSVGQPWEQKLAPMEQLACSHRMFAGLRHKIIRYNSGNHDRDRGYGPVGVDLAEVLGRLLRVPYGHVETVIDLNFKGHLFTLILHHGSGGGRSIQAILKEAERYREHAGFFVHWHMSGHVHNSFIKPGMATRKVTGEGLYHQRYFTIIGGSYMGRTGTYAEETKYNPTPQDLTFITLRANGSYDAGSVNIDCV